MQPAQHNDTLLMLNMHAVPYVHGACNRLQAYELCSKKKISTVAGMQAMPIQQHADCNRLSCLHNGAEVNKIASQVFARVYGHVADPYVQTLLRQKST